MRAASCNLLTCDMQEAAHCTETPSPRHTLLCHSEGSVKGLLHRGSPRKHVNSIVILAVRPSLSKDI